MACGNNAHMNSAWTRHGNVGKQYSWLTLDQHQGINPRKTGASITHKLHAQTREARRLAAAARYKLLHFRAWGRCTCTLLVYLHSTCKRKEDAALPARCSSKCHFMYPGG